MSSSRAVIWDHITSPLDQSLTDFGQASETFNPLNHALSHNEVTEQSVRGNGGIGSGDDQTNEPFVPDGNYLRNVRIHMFFIHSSSINTGVSRDVKKQM